MAYTYCTPLSICCARFMAKHTFSSALPTQWQHIHIAGSAIPYLQARKAIRIPIPAIHCSFSSERNKPPRSVKVAAFRRGELGVVTADTWDEYVLSSDVPVLVEFWAGWCGPCRMVNREIEEIAREYAGRINCYLLKVDEDMEVAEKYDIKVVPVVLLFKNGEKRDCLTGTMPYDIYAAAIEKLLAS